MSESQHFESGTQDLSRAPWMDRLVREYENAWQRALQGEPRPDMASFLADCDPSERVAVRRELETMDRDFEQRQTARAGGRNDDTSVFEPSIARRDTDLKGTGETVALAPGDSPEQAATINLSADESPSQEPDATINLASRVALDWRQRSIGKGSRRVPRIRTLALWTPDLRWA